jgi:hypothetical protein
MQRTMKTELVYLALDDQRLSALAQASEATGRSIEELIQAPVAEFLDQGRDANPRSL